MKAQISEVFSSIQGEGMYLGEKQIFVRFFGCNLSCRFCDTPLRGFKEYEVGQLWEEIKSYRNNFHSISFTGGEPLLQNDFLKEILVFTRAAGHKNYLETNGTLFFHLKEVINDVDIVAMDIKLSSSTGMGNILWMHRKFLEIASAKEVFLKAIVCLSTTEEDLLGAITLIKEVNNQAVLVLQPNSFEYGKEMPEKLTGFRNLCRNEGVNVRVIPQIHKMMEIK
ncbi:MAG: 7-carboxy-7-deazaguanine synthase QueE [Candidatus Omnitrophota bacterium]